MWSGVVVGFGESDLEAAKPPYWGPLAEFSQAPPSQSGILWSNGTACHGSATVLNSNTNSTHVGVCVGVVVCVGVCVVKGVVVGVGVGVVVGLGDGVGIGINVAVY